MGCANWAQPGATPAQLGVAPGLGLGVNPGLGLGVNPGLGLIGEILDHYKTLSFLDKNGKPNLETIVEITTKLLCKYGLQKHPRVTLSVGSSMIALTLSLLILAAIVATNDGSDPSILFWTLFIIKVSAFCALEVLIIPRLTRWFFRHYADALIPVLRPLVK